MKILVETYSIIKISLNDPVRFTDVDTLSSWLKWCDLKLLCV